MSQNYLRNVKVQHLFFFLVLFVVSACNEVVDAERPTIAIDLPAQNDIVTTNDGLRIVATLTDDTGLLQYKLTLSGVDSENGVSSDSTSSFILVDGVPNNEKALYLDEVFPLSDTTFNGIYQVVLACIDVEGNESLNDTAQFAIKNNIDSDPPQFDVDPAGLQDTMTLENGFTILGTTTDAQNLIFSDIYVGTVGGGDTILYYAFDNVVNNAVEYTPVGWFFIVDSTWTQGDYHLNITSWDDYSGASYEFPFHVSY